LGAELVDGRIYGRGACDMKCGTTAAIFTFCTCANCVTNCKGG